MGLKTIAIRFFAVSMCVVGIILMTLNLYGVTQSIRYEGLGKEGREMLRFVPEEVWSYEDSMKNKSDWMNSGTEIEKVIGATKWAHKSLVHVSWDRVSPKDYRQLIPIWDNYFLHFIGRFSDLPQFERYHFSDYKRTVARGIGLCGDYSIVLSQALSEVGIKTDIVSYPGHVVVYYYSENGDIYYLDPDFGVVTKLEGQDFEEYREILEKEYLSNHSESEVEYLMNILSYQPVFFKDTYDFMAKRYIFERFSYFAKWLFPLLFLFVGLCILVIGRRVDNR